MRQWISAWKQANLIVLRDLQKRLRPQLRRLPEEELFKNGQELLEVDVEDWFANIAFVQFAKSHPHAEESHWDGGAACALMGLTLWGQRDLALLPGEASAAEGKCEAVFRNAPGSFYLTNLVPVKHQVRYPAPAMRDLRKGVDTLMSPDLGEVGVHVMFRTPLFSAGFGQCARALPNPAQVWRIYAETFMRWQADWTFQMPSLAAVQAATAE